MSYPTITILVPFAFAKRLVRGASRREEKRLVPFTKCLPQQRRGSANESTITTTLVIFDSQVADLPLLYNALLPGSIAHTIQPSQDSIDRITHLLTETGATKLAIVAHGQPGSIQIGNGAINRAMVEARSGLLQEWGLDLIALYSCEVGADTEFVQRFGELTGARIAASTSKVGAGNWDLDGGMELLSIDRLADYSDTLTIFSGTAGNDYASTSAGFITGFSGGTVTNLNDITDDIFDGLDGDDFVQSGNGNNIFYGGNGNDSLYGNGGFDTIFGGAGIDTLSGGGLNDFIFGGTENDIINGDDGQDFLYGEDGNDTLKGGYGFDIIYGQAGDDIIYGEGVTVNAGGTDTTVAPAPGVGTNDTIFGGLGNDWIRGGIGDDVLLGEEGSDTIFGNDGNDFIYGGDGFDYLYGGDNNDYLVGQDGNDLIYGEAGVDYLEGGNGNDTLDGQEGNDFLYGNAGVDYLYGNLGDDFLDGGDNDDFLYGQFGNDVLFGVEGDDVLRGDVGNDFLYGGNGNDFLSGNEGSDFLIGGAGSDTFRYFNIDDAGDTITDFSVTEMDKLDLTNLVGIFGGNANTNYIQFVQSGANTILQVDRDGTAGIYGFVTMATLSNINTSQLSIGTNVLV
jgi:Ca2+-binding RTX toxin-like protein